MDNFLTCQNCVRWGLPWKLQHKLVVCHERKDKAGDFYSPGSKACRYFVPKSQLPKDLQFLRLFTQALNPTQLSYVTYAAEQATLLLNVSDAEGAPLALGDLVFFTREDRPYYGTVEGLEPSNTKNLCLWSPAFPNESVLIKTTAVRKAKTKELADLIQKQLQLEPTKPTIDLHKEISRLRSSTQLTEEQRQELLHNEEQYAQLYAETKYLAALSTFRSNL